MPKGHKISRGYATVGELGGLDYRRIAEQMTEDGHRMNHATARNVFLRAMRKIAKRACASFDGSLTDDDITRIAKHPLFQGAIQDIMHDSLE